MDELARLKHHLMRKCDEVTSVNMAMEDNLDNFAQKAALAAIGASCIAVAESVDAVIAERNEHDAKITQHAEKES